MKLKSVKNKFFHRIKSLNYLLKEIINISPKRLKNKNLSKVAINLSKDGFHVFENLIDKDLLESLQKECDQICKDSLKNKGQLKGRVCARGALTQNLEYLSEKFKPYAKEFIADNVKLEISYYQISKSTLDLEDVPGGHFHVDDNKSNLKLFVYLTDVDKDSGPFVAVPRTGSFKLRGSRIRALFWEIFHKRFFLYKFLVNYNKYEKIKKSFVGLAGTHFIVDTTSLHKDTQVKKGIRKVAVVSFNRD